MSIDTRLNLLHILLPIIFIVEYLPIYGFRMMSDSTLVNYWHVLLTILSVSTAFIRIRQPNSKLYNYLIFLTLVLLLPRIQLYLHSTGFFIVLVLNINRLINNEELSKFVFWGFIVTGALPILVSSQIFGVYYGYIISLLNIFITVVYIINDVVWSRS